MRARLGLRCLALGYLALIIAGPVALLLWRTFEGGPGPFWEAVTRPDAIHALKLTGIVALIVVPLNTLFGVLCALAIVRAPSRASSLLNAAIDIPLGISPVVVGLALISVYGRDGWFGGRLNDAGIQVIFSTPGIVLATLFVSLPFVVREVVPVLREVGVEQEEAARTLGAGPLRTFRTITLPAIWPGIAYGVVLTTARAIGEFGAVSIVSGRIIGQTATATLYVEERFQGFDLQGAYAMSVVLALLGSLTLVAMQLVKRKVEQT